RYISPAENQVFLGVVLGPMGVAEDQAGDPIEVVDDRDHQEIERVTISFLCPPDQLDVRHVPSPRCPIAQSRDQPYWREPRRYCSKFAAALGPEKRKRGAQVARLEIA